MWFSCRTTVCFVRSSSYCMFHTIIFLCSFLTNGSMYAFLSSAIALLTVFLAMLLLQYSSSFMLRRLRNFTMKILEKNIFSFTKYMITTSICHNSDSIILICITKRTKTFVFYRIKKIWFWVNQVYTITNKKSRCDARDGFLSNFLIIVKLIFRFLVPSLCRFTQLHHQPLELLFFGQKYKRIREDRLCEIPFIFLWLFWVKFFHIHRIFGKKILKSFSAVRKVVLKNLQNNLRKI